MEKRRELVRRSDVDALIDDIAGVTLTALSSLAARCAPRGDLATRRSIERVVFEVRTEMANVCQETVRYTKRTTNSLPNCGLDQVKVVRL